MRSLLLLLVLLPAWAYAADESDMAIFPVPQSTIARGSIITGNLLTNAPIQNAPVNAVRDEALLIGQQAKRLLPAGKPILMGDVATPVLVKRNDMVTLIYQNDLLLLSTSGRSLGEGGLGASIPVMNIASRKTVTGTIQADGTVRVNSQQSQQGASE